MSGHGAYGGYDIKQLFRMVDAARNDLPQTYAQIQAWQRAEDMLAAHSKTLLECRNALTAQWSPDQNEAAAVYLGHLDDLLGTVDQTAQAVATNRGLLEQMATDITNTHRTLEPLYREYLSNEQKLAAYQAELNAAQGAGAAAGDAAGRGAGIVAGGGSTLLAGVFGKVGSAVFGSAAKAGMQLVTTPPVAAGRQDQINQQARDAIVKLGGTADDTSSHLQPPPPYQPPRVTIGSETHIGDGTTGGAIRPAAIAPPAHTHASNISGPSASGDPGQMRPAPGGQGAPGPTGRDPVLAGGPVATMPAPAPGTGITHLAPGPIGSPTPGPIFGVPPVVSGPSRMPGTGGGKLPTPGVGIGEPGIGIEEPGGTFLPRAGRALPPGGVIGDSELGIGPAGRGAIGARRINPVGGVLGEGEGGIGVGGSRGAAAGRGAAGRIGGAGVGERGELGLGALGGRRGRRRADGEEHTWDPDNPWEVVDGVTPVIVPGEEPQSHDAGPGVIGIDR